MKIIAYVIGGALLGIIGTHLVYFYVRVKYVVTVGDVIAHYTSAALYYVTIIVLSALGIYVIHLFSQLLRAWIDIGKIEEKAQVEADNKIKQAEEYKKQAEEYKAEIAEEYRKKAHELALGTIKKRKEYRKHMENGEKKIVELIGKNSILIGHIERITKKHSEKHKDNPGRVKQVFNKNQKIISANRVQI